ncbi:MAG TPA: TfoX/Sxy family protein [Thermoplasmata archaeon]|nr:TfoX/Sxy family protein [Thermoplasmata archaeon]
MAYSKALADRVRKALGARPRLTERQMFGGVAFLLGGNMCSGVRGEDLFVRVEPAETEALLREPDAKPFTIGGRPGSPGWLLVGPSGYRTEAALKAWVARGVAFATSLPPKKGERT